MSRSLDTRDAVAVVSRFSCRHAAAASVDACAVDLAVEAVTCKTDCNRFALMQLQRIMTAHVNIFAQELHVITHVTAG